MDFDYTPQEETFRQELRAWLTVNPLARYDPATFLHLDQDARFAIQLNWQKQLHRAGWVGIHWPKAYGGRGATVMEQTIYRQEMVRARLPEIANFMGTRIAGPTLIHWGTEEQKKRYIPTILNGEEIWCQGYSEPGAGSDIAALQTRAVEEGDDFVINGQKVWTSYAQYARFCLLLARTDPTAPKHKGISCFVVDMHTPGITVRPLRQINGDAEFNEVFFDNVRVPKANLIGDKNQGWQVAMTTLMFERVTFDVLSPVEAVIEQLVDVVKRAAADASVVDVDISVRQQVAKFYIELQAIKYSSLRQLTRQLRGEPPGPESSLVKLAASELNQRVVLFATALLGPASQVVSQSEQGIDGSYWMHSALSTHLYTIAGGTSEIQRNILGERVLGLSKG
ncbi:MAG: acyl-CoA dehydrogenase family protein [Deltaproteobacteria bacterium]|nr:acyl-CoA dehydrogenase family protein [Deltaproteobacteria bacterium]